MGDVFYRALWFLHNLWEQSVVIYANLSCIHLLVVDFYIFVVSPKHSHDAIGCLFLILIYTHLEEYWFQGVDITSAMLPEKYTQCLLSGYASRCSSEDVRRRYNHQYYIHPGGVSRQKDALAK